MFVAVGLVSLVAAVSFDFLRICTFISFF
jgi:hypothetical protein